MSKWNMPIAFTLKTLIGLYFLFIYTEFYGNGTLSADAGAFMEESKILNDVFYSSPLDYFKFISGFGDDTALQHQYLLGTHHWDAGAQALINDNKNILRIHSLIHFVSFNNPIVHVLFMCLIATIGAKNLLIGLSSRIDLSKNIQFWILILIPSVLFWTSGILKEPLMFVGIGILIRGLLAKEGRTKRIIYIILGCFLLLNFKPYVLFSIIPALIFFGFYSVLPKYKIVGALLALFILTSSALLIFSEKRDQAVHLITRKQQDFKNIGKGGVFAWNGDGFYYFEPNLFDDLIVKDRFVTLKKSMNATLIDPGGFESPVPVKVEKDGKAWPIYFMREESRGYIEIAQINNSFSQLLLNVPGAIRNSLFRPYFNDPGSWLKFPAMLEVWIIFLFLGFAIYRRRKLSSQDGALITAVTIFILTLSTIIGLTTPVLGAIVRYRIPIIIAIVLIALLIVNTDYLNKGVKKQIPET